jgi:hypothetical protein
VAFNYIEFQRIAPTIDLCAKFSFTLKGHASFWDTEGTGSAEQQVALKVAP